MEDEEEKQVQESTMLEEEMKAQLNPSTQGMQSSLNPSLFDFRKLNVGFPLQLLFGPIFLYTNMFKGNSIRQKAHRVVEYLKLKWSDLSIELRELAY